MMTEWTPTWRKQGPEDREVVVKVALRDNTFRHDIGQYYPMENRWHVQFWSESRVVAWAPIPSDNT